MEQATQTMSTMTDQPMQTGEMVSSQSSAPKAKRPPSIEAVKAYYRGEKDSVGRLLGTYFGRATLLAIGFSLLSKKEDAIKNGLIGSGIIELYLLWFYRSKRT